MNASPHFPRDSTGATTAETTADLSENLDEALDVQLGLASLAGLRHSAACEATEKSNRRYDDRNHRFHESRMKKLGMEGEEPEAEDMSQQVLIRSPITHNHYQQQPAAPQPSSWWKKPAAIAAIMAAMGGGAAVPLAIDAMKLDAPAAVTPAAKQEISFPKMTTRKFVPEKPAEPKP